MFVAVPVGEIEKANGNAGRAPIGGHIVEPHADQSLGFVRRKFEMNLWCAQNFKWLGERRAGEDQGAAVIFALIAGPFGIFAITAHFASTEADPQGRTDANFPGNSFLRTEGAAEIEIVFFVGDAWGRPTCLGNPATGPFQIAGPGRNGILHPGAVHRFFHHAGVDVFQPLIEPTYRFLQPADCRCDRGIKGIGMGPRPHKPQPWAFQRGKQAGNSFRIIIGPAAHGINRNFDF